MIKLDDQAREMLTIMGEQDDREEELPFDIPE
jgi:hypothetical protein